MEIHNVIESEEFSNLFGLNIDIIDKISSPSTCLVRKYYQDIQLKVTMEH